MTWNKDKCIRCNLCLELCPYKAILFDSDNERIVNERKCEAACSICFYVCPVESIGNKEENDQ